MKKLVVFYSYEGNTKLIAESIANSIGADILELKPINEMKSKGFMKFVWGGRDAVMKKRPKLNDFNINFDDYDQIIIGTPVWAFTYAPPFNTLFSEYNIVNKDIALFCCHEGGMGMVFNNLKKNLHGNNIIGEYDFINVITENSEQKIKMAIEWAKTL